MVVYLYNHDVNEIEEDACYLGSDDVRIGKGTKYSASKDNVSMVRYCEHCNSTLVGHWEYVKFYLETHLWDSYAREKYDNKVLCWQLEYELKNENERNYTYFDKNGCYLSNKFQNDIDSFCYNLPQLKEGEKIRFDFDEQKKIAVEPFVSVSPKIIQYREEIEKFFSMITCPICKNKLRKQINRHIYFTGPDFLYMNLCEKFPNHMFEEHNYTELFKKSEIPDYIFNLPKGEPFVHNGRLATKLSSRPNDDLYQIYYYKDSSLKSMLIYFNHFLVDEFDKPARLKIEETTEKFNIKPASKVFNKSSFDTDALINYLNYICQLESNVFSVTERLKELYTMHFASKKDAMASQLIPAINLKKELEERKKSYAELEKTVPEKDISIEDFAFDYPEKPTAPEIPEQPTLKPAGLFNKKKIEAENNLLTQEYQAKLAAYNVEMEIYAEKLRKYNCIIEESEQKQKEMYSAKIEEALKCKQEKLDKLSLEIVELENRITEIENTDSDIVTPEKIKNELIEAEISEAEKLLCKTYKALNEIYSYGVIFDKYRNFVAVSTFYEYLSSGRCTALEGADGAYNIYENEIRTNQMISQLSQVIASLDKIQQNQYVVYSAIQESNKQLAQLNSSMTSAVSALDSIDITTKNMSSTMKKIAEDTAVSAYNSSVAAYYSKKNAELTNALGYMIALS